MSIASIFDSMDYGTAPESADMAETWIAQNKGRFNLFLNGQWTKPKSGKWFDSVNPATNETLGSIAMADKKDVDAAVKAARGAQKGWAGLGGHGRARYLYALARAIQKHGRILSVLESLDNGKPIRESRDIDIPLVARHFYHHAGWAQLADQELGGFDPVGVVGQIIPWNFPLLMLAWKIAPALAAGNTVVLKPAEDTSLSALYFATLCQQIGLPKGVVNIVTGAGNTGEAITTHPDIDKIAFTGSTEVGRLIRRATAGSAKELTLELGGKSPFIVFEDADLDSAVEGVVDAIWFNQGQVCCAGSRLLLQEGIADRMTAKLKARMEKLRLGDPLDKCIDMGAIVSPAQLATISKMVDQGVRDGLEMWQPSKAPPAKGCYFPPTLFSNVAPAATLAREEIFGPVLVSITFRTPGEAVSIANNIPYGLAASVWSENINLALDVAPKLDCGVVWINSTNQFDAACGFGGTKESGFGREGGREGMMGYMKPSFLKTLPDIAQVKAKSPATNNAAAGPVGIDRTAKLYIGGKQARPDSGYSLGVVDAKGRYISDVGHGNRKDIRNAVEAARKAEAWSKASSHNRAQVIYYIAENLDARADEFARRLQLMTGITRKKADAEVAASVSRLFSYGAWADKFDGAVHSPPLRGVTLAMNEAIGTVGAICPDQAPLLSMISLAAPLIAMGNRVVVVPSEQHPLIATDFYQVLETSDLPAGVLNIVTGPRDELAKTLAEHDDVKSVWYFGPKAGSALVELASAGNMKRSWVNNGKARDWSDPVQSEGPEFLRHATQVKNIWIPYGE